MQEEDSTKLNFKGLEMQKWNNQQIEIEEQMKKNWIILSSYHGYFIVIRNEKIVWKVVWIEYYLRLNLSSQRY